MYKVQELSTEAMEPNVFTLCTRNGTELIWHHKVKAEGDTNPCPLGYQVREHVRQVREARNTHLGSEMDSELPLCLVHLLPHARLRSLTHLTWWKGDQLWERGTNNN